MTTINSLTDTQIRQIRREALAHGDDKMAVICDIALDTELDGNSPAFCALCPDGRHGAGHSCEGRDVEAARVSTRPSPLSDYYTGLRLTAAEWRELDTMDQDDAREECARVIADAEAQG